jgi:hypothetical protein
MVPADASGEQEHRDGDHSRAQEMNLNPLACVPDNCPTDELQIHETSGQQAEALYLVGIRGQFFARAFFPLSRSEQSKTCGQGEECLRETGMDNRQGLL